MELQRLWSHTRGQRQQLRDLRREQVHIATRREVCATVQAVDDLFMPKQDGVCSERGTRAALK